MAMKFWPHLTLEENFARITFQSQLPLAKKMAEFATWMFTGVAVIIGAVVVNIEAVSTTLDDRSLKWGLIWLVISLLAGSFAKQAGEAIATGFASADALLEFLDSPEASANFEHIHPEKLRDLLTSAYLWPLNAIVGRAYMRGAKSSLYGERYFMKMFTVQMYLMWTQSAAACSGILIWSLGIK